jgi:hypothetical protein
MSAKTNYLEDAIIDHVLRNSALSSPTTVYCALYTVTPGEAGGGTEVSGGSYARQSVAFSDPVDGASSNVSAITFPTASENWGEIVAFAILDDVSAGNMLYYGALAVNKTVLSGDVFEFLSGQLSVTEA